MSFLSAFVGAWLPTFGWMTTSLVVEGRVDALTLVLGFIAGHVVTLGITLVFWTGCLLPLALVLTASNTLLRPVPLFLLGALVAGAGSLALFPELWHAGVGACVGGAMTVLYSVWNHGVVSGLDSEGAAPTLVRDSRRG